MADIRKPPETGRSKVLLAAFLIIVLFMATASATAVLGQTTQQKNQSPETTNALDPVLNISCRPKGNALDKARVNFEDRATDESHYKIERSINFGPWQTIKTIKADQGLYGKCTKQTGCTGVFIDSGLNTILNHQYRVRPYRESDKTTGAASPVCRKLAHYDSTNFRIFYRIADCPAINGEPQCVPHVFDANMNNVTAVRIANIMEGARAAFSRVGFTPLTLGSGGPWWSDLIGFAGGLYGECCGQGIRVDATIAATPINLATAAGIKPLDTTTHETFHAQTSATYGGLNNDPFGAWWGEGHASWANDKFCVGTQRSTCLSQDTSQHAEYTGRVNSYLGNTNVNLTRLTYAAALFWTYVTEQYGQRIEEPERGVDLVVRFWQEVQKDRNDDGIGVLNRTLKGLGHTAKFEDVFKDFVVAVYAKELTGTVPAKYQIIDEQQSPAIYRSVNLAVDQTLHTSDSLADVSDVVAWGARYFQLRPDASVSTLDIRVRQDSANRLQYVVLAINSQGDIVKEVKKVGRHFDLLLPNNSYDRVVLIVAALGSNSNFRYTVNARKPVVNIMDPVQGHPARAGSPSSPDKILVKVEVMSLDGATPISGIPPGSFKITIGGQALPSNGLISSSYIQGQYWLLIRAPSQTTGGLKDLQVELWSPFTTPDTETDAVRYGTLNSSDNVLIIDRSGSMGFFGGSKLQAAKDGARLYVDSWRSGDMIGAVQFNHQNSVLVGLQAWNNTSRVAANSAINGITATGGTCIGAALNKGMDETIKKGSSAHEWVLILLSDGKEECTAAGSKISDFLAAYRTRSDAGQQVPQVHTIAIGPDAMRGPLSTVASRTGGLYHYASEPLPLNATQKAAASPELTSDLAEIYRVIGESVINDQQVYAERGFVLIRIPTSHTIFVDNGTAEAIFVANWDSTLSPPTVTLKRPNGTDAGPPTLTDPGHVLWRIPTPAGGEWQVNLSQQGCDVDCAGHHLVEAAVKSDLTMDVFLGLPLELRQAGRPMPIFVTLSDLGPIPHAMVEVEITSPTGMQFPLVLYDDGNHHDGSAGDGFYGSSFAQTYMPGSYVGVVHARGESEVVGTFHRRLRVSFNMDGAEDSDDDNLPNWWEIENGTDPERWDADRDHDGDGLSAFDEFLNGTHPHDPDTDDGGEGDGSEVANGRNPLESDDDTIARPSAAIWPAVGEIYLRYGSSPETAFLLLERMQNPDEGFLPLAELPPINEATGLNDFVDGELENGRSVCYRVRAIGEAGQESAVSEPVCTVPREDPIPPSGAVTAAHLEITEEGPLALLSLQAADNVVPRRSGPYEPPVPVNAESSGVAEVMLATDGTFEGSEWQPYEPFKPILLQPDEHGFATVYVKFRDHVGNESETEVVTIDLEAANFDQALYLPLISKP